MTKGQAENHVVRLQLKVGSSITLSEGTGMNPKTICIRIGDDENILMNYTIKDVNNKTIAEVVDSKPVYVDEAFEYTHKNDSLIIRNKKTKDVYLDFRYPSPSKIMLSGIQSVIGKNFVRIDDELNVDGIQLKA